jgi:hypothetical protein
MTGTLSKDQIAAFRTRGYHFPLDVLSEEQAASSLSRLQNYEQVADRVGGILYAHRFFPKMHLLTRWADGLVRNPRMLDAVESLIGPDILVWGTQVFVRRAGTGESLAWHQDALYFGLHGFEANSVRVWLALTPTSADNGTLRYSTGSHLGGIRVHGYRAEDTQRTARGEEVLMDIAPETEVEVVLRAGQASMHTMLIAHASGINVTDADRVNFAIDFLTPEVIPAGPADLPDSALLVRGASTGGHFRLEQAPKTDFGNEELKCFFEATALRSRRINHFFRTVREEPLHAAGS